MPREVRITTKSRFRGSGPRKEAKIPGVEETVSSVTLARPSRASIRPPLLFSTAAMTVAMPPSMIIPWRKSLMAVAMYPPAITYTAVSTAISRMQTE